MWQEGRTYHEIGMALHCSRSTVAGHIYRHRAGMGTAVPGSPKSPAAPKPKRVKAAPTQTKRRRTGPNNATDPDTRAVVDLISESELLDTQIADLSGVHRDTIARWRKGRKGRTFELECVREALTATEL